MGQIAASQVVQTTTAQGTVDGIVKVLRTTGYVIGARVSCNKAGQAGILAKVVGIPDINTLVLRDTSLPDSNQGSPMTYYGAGTLILQEQQFVTDNFPLYANATLNPGPSVVQVPAHTDVLISDGQVGYVRVAAPDGFQPGSVVTLTSDTVSAEGLKVYRVENEKVYLWDMVVEQYFDASAFTVSNNASMAQAAQAIFFNVTFDKRSPPMSEYEAHRILTAILPASGGTVGPEGPPGPPGPPGGSSDVTSTANGAVTAGAGVYVNAGGGYSAGDASNDAKVNVVGIAVNSAANGAPLTVRFAGVVTGVLTGATLGNLYYLGATGLPTLYANITSGWRLIQLGEASSATDLVVNIFDYGRKP